MAENLHSGEFQTLVQELQRKLEKRRRYYLRQFFGAWILCGICLTGLVFAPAATPMPAVGPNGATLETTVEWTAASLQIACLIFGALLSGLLALATPLIYRGRNRNVGLNPQKFSLKDAIFSPMLRYFGPWEYAPDAASMQLRLKDSALLPAYDEFRAEDLLQGRVHDCLIYLAQVALVKVEKQTAKNIFHGLIAVIDISEMGVRLRAPFAGHTLLLTDANKDDALAASFRQYPRVPLPSQALEARYEAFGSDAAEAASLLQPEMLEMLERLANYLHTLKQQRTHADDKIGWAITRWLDSFTLALGGRADFEKRQDEAGGGFDAAKANPPAANAGFYQRSLQLECREDKIVLLLPMDADPFEPNSLFEPALVPEDSELVWKLMTTLLRLAEWVDTVRQPTVLPD